MRRESHEEWIIITDSIRELAMNPFAPPQHHLIVADFVDLWEHSL